MGGARGIYQEGWVLSPTGTFKIPGGMRDKYSSWFPWIIHLTHVLESGVSIMLFRRTGPMARSTWDNGVAWLNAKFLCVPRMLGPESASGMGRAHGLGHIKHSDGDSYTGEWYNGRAHGCGVYRFQDGAACYEGQFRCDHRDGLGVESWVDGSCPLAPKRWIGVEQSNMKHRIGDGNELDDFPKTT